METGRPVALVVDDVADIVEELLILLIRHDIPAVGAASLDEALDALRREPGIRVISCDVRLDRERGTDIVSRIAECAELQTRDYRYLFMTGDPMQIDTLLSVPDWDVLSKPVSPDLLIRTLKRMLTTTHALN